MPTCIKGSGRQNQLKTAPDGNAGLTFAKVFRNGVNFLRGRVEKT